MDIKAEALEGEDLYSGHVPLSGWSMFIRGFFCTLTAAVVKVVDYTTEQQAEEQRMVNPSQSQTSSESTIVLDSDEIQVSQGDTEVLWDSSTGMMCSNQRWVHDWRSLQHFTFFCESSANQRFHHAAVFVRMFHSSATSSGNAQWHTLRVGWPQCWGRGRWVKGNPTPTSSFSKWTVIFLTHLTSKSSVSLNVIWPKNHQVFFKQKQLINCVSSADCSCTIKFPFCTLVYRSQHAGFKMPIQHSRCPSGESSRFCSDWSRKQNCLL